MRQLGQLEAVVMDRLWSEDRPVSVRDVLESLRQDRTIAYTTVMTVLDNLHGKEMVTREKDGRAFRYRPRLTRQEHAASLMRQVLASSDDREAVLLHFVEHMPVEEAARLRAALDGVAPDPDARLR